LNRKHVLVTTIGALIGAVIAIEILPESIGVPVFITVFGLVVLYQFGELGRALVKGVCWLVSWTVRLIRPARSDARTTPDRTGP
jgi:hypothetical protein